VTEPLPFFSRFALAFVCFFRVLFDGIFAARVRGLSSGEAPPPAPEKADPPEPGPPKSLAPPPVLPALQLLGLLQREGRLVDFLKQDIASFPDADIGAAARVVHEGCRKALFAHAEIDAIRSESEGSPLTLAEGFDAESVKLTGNVAGKAPYRGTLRHKGWRVSKLELPTALPGHDASVLAPAEVEL